MITPTAMEKIKLTKSALNSFIIWSTSRYNDYLGFGTKKENVTLVFNSLLQGFYAGFNGKGDPTKTKFRIECSAGNGEGYGNRYWKLKGRKGDYLYEIDCIEKTITGLPSGESLAFYLPKNVSALNS
jgi:hypothetical protein